MSGCTVTMRGWHDLGLHDDAAALAPALTVLRLGLDLLTEAAGFRGECELHHLLSIMTATTDQVGRRAVFVLDRARGESAA